MREKVLAIGFIPKIVPLLNDLESHIKTDLPLTELNKLLLEGRKVNQYSAQTLVLSDDFLTDSYSNDGQYIIMPKEGMDNWSKIIRLIYNMKQGITPSPMPSI